MSDVYKTAIVCHNCRYFPTDTKGHNIKVEIPKGISIEHHLQDLKCKNCGCIGFIGIA